MADASVTRQPNGLWQPGHSGNPDGRPVGTRNKFSEQFYRDIAAEWQRSGPDALAKMALTDPSRYVSVCASLIPKDVSLTLSARLPGGLESDDWQLMLEVLGAVKLGLPDANKRPPGEVMQHVLSALQLADAKVIGHTENPSEMSGKKPA